MRAVVALPVILGLVGAIARMLSMIALQLHALEHFLIGHFVVAARMLDRLLGAREHTAPCG